MKQAAITIAFLLMFTLAGLGQNPKPGDSQYPSPDTSPSTSPAQSPDMSNPAQNTTSESKGDKKLKGCIVSEGGKYVLQEKRGKEVALTGAQDLAAHVGHTVAVHGSFAGGANASATPSASGNSGMSNEQQFMVTRIDMISDSCNTLDKNKGNGKSGPDHE